jgi:hypothetical protein
MLSELPSTVVHCLDLAAFLLFHLALFTVFVLALYRLVRREWRKK